VEIHPRERRPYNPLHDQNYPSIGCTHCTAPVTPGGDERAGRWPARRRPSAVFTESRLFDRLHN